MLQNENQVPAAARKASAAQTRMVREVLVALRDTPRRLPTQYLYDAKGSALFEQITTLPEYYPTRTELAIFERSLPEMAAALGPEAWIIELGSGDGRKTLRLLEALDRPAGYTPIEISRGALDASVRTLRESLPGLAVVPLRGDFTLDFTLPDTPCRKRVCFFPGSTLGNFGDADARALLRCVARWVGPGGGLLIGVDLVKSPDILVPAYDDVAGVTAAFNLNLLDRLNREANADFDRNAWSHRAIWNADEQRMESYLVSGRAQQVRIDGEGFAFDKGETIWTEQSQKSTLERLGDMAECFDLRSSWQDERGWCAVAYLEAYPEP